MRASKAPDNWSKWTNYLGAGQSHVQARVASVTNFVIERASVANEVLFVQKWLYTFILNELQLTNSISFISFGK